MPKLYLIWHKNDKICNFFTILISAYMSANQSKQSLPKLWVKLTKIQRGIYFGIISWQFQFFFWLTYAYSTIYIGSFPSESIHLVESFYLIIKWRGDYFQSKLSGRLRNFTLYIISMAVIHPSLGWSEWHCANTTDRIQGTGTVRGNAEWLPFPSTYNVVVLVQHKISTITQSKVEVDGWCERMAGPNEGMTSLSLPA